MSVVGSQQQTYLRLVAVLRPHWRSDAALPARIQTLLARNRQFGSRDRRLYRELLYTTLRYLPWIEPSLDTEPTRAARIAAWLSATTRDTAAYRSELCGDWPDAKSLADRATFLGADPATLLPAWFRTECDTVFTPAELEAQLARAPLWLRLQAPDADRVSRELSERGWRWRAADVLPSAWQLLDDADVTQTEAYQSGAIEIQDLGSQLLLEAIAPVPGGHWLDACAGAGGKTLQLARLLGSAGRIDAADIRAAALDELAARATRAGIPVIAAQTKGPAAPERRPPSSHHSPIYASEGAAPTTPPADGRAAPIVVVAPGNVPAVGAIYDGILVDAPCSGSGTWRRAPHLKWTTTPATLVEKAALQRALLDRHASLVKPGGLLVYATCSLARSENDAVVSAFLEQHPEFEPAGFRHTFGFTPGPRGMTLLPALHDTDGFFVAPLRRTR